VSYLPVIGEKGRKIGHGALLEIDVTRAANLLHFAG